MKALVISDSHGRIENACYIIELLSEKIDTVIHLGDYCEDAYYISEKYKTIPFINVKGNCDYNSAIPNEKLVCLGGKNIFLTHGHKYNVKSSYVKLSYAAEEKNADICLCGHTHTPVCIKFSNIIIMNPGSISFPRNSDCCSYGIIDITEKETSVSVVGIYKNNLKIIAFKKL